MMSDDKKDPRGDTGHPGSDARDGLLSDLAGRILRVGAEAVSVGAEKLREKGESAASLGARGKEEVMTLLANEIRGYIEKLKVGDEIRSFLDDYTLEVSASVRLKAHEPGEEPPTLNERVSVDVGFEPLVPIAPEPAPEPKPAPKAPVVEKADPPKKPTAKKPAATKKRTTRKKRTTGGAARAGSKG